MQNIEKKSTMNRINKFRMGLYNSSKIYNKKQYPLGNHYNFLNFCLIESAYEIDNLCCVYIYKIGTKMCRRQNNIDNNLRRKPQPPIAAGCHGHGFHHIIGGKNASIRIHVKC